MAHLAPYERPKCWCGEWATCRVIGLQNIVRGYFCDDHGEPALQAYHAEDANKSNAVKKRRR